MFKQSKWAEIIIENQNEDGSWGIFHTLSEPTKKKITTEQALRRLDILGYTIEDECISKAVTYMRNCLMGEQIIPDVREKTHDWNIFTELMLSTWIRKFTDEDHIANQVAKKWAKIITCAFQDGSYSHGDYLEAYGNTFSQKANGDRLVDFVNFYQVSLTADMYTPQIEKLVFNHIMNHRGGIYYVGYRKTLLELPDEFSSKQTSKFIASIEMMTSYKNSHNRLKYVVDWINSNKEEDNSWDLGKSSKDFIYLPLADSWRIKNSRIEDSTYIVNKLLEKIK